VRTKVRAVVRGTPDSEQCLSGAALDCPVPLKDKTSNGLKLPNPNSWVTWLAHGTVSGGAPDCPVCPSTSATPNGCLVVEGYKYPPTTSTPRIQVSSTSHSTQELVHSLQDTFSIESKPLQVPNTFHSPSDLRESLFVFFILLLLGSLS
jgi:hypothetical protein